ncbi:MAG: DUF4236 domain-containing protein [Vitreimonas sp.]
MGFYIRKSGSLGGGVRLNLSSKGLGISAGVKGFRVGMNGRGTYVHMGRGGLYYRKQFSYAPPKRNPPSVVQHSPTDPAPDVVYTQDLNKPLNVESAPVDTQRVADHFKKRNRPYWIAVLLALFALMSLQNLPILILFVVGCVVSLVLIERARARDVLIYDLECTALESFSQFVNAFETYFSSDRMWQYTSRSFTHDLKRNAGANWLMDRKPAISITDTEKVFRTNLSLPSIRMGEQMIVFLPDLIVIGDGKSLGAFRYNDVRLANGLGQFVESAGVPRDAKVVGHAWRYQNKNGDPDRRFKNNYQIPICLYEEVGFGVDSVASVGRVFAKSSQTNFAAFNAAYERLSGSTAQMREIDPTRALPGAA